MKKILVLLIGLSACVSALAQTEVKVYRTDDSQQLIGTVTAKDSAYGLLLVPNLTGLTPGAHGFHVHEMPSCTDHGLAAKGHFDPAGTKQHSGPYRADGHLGDLPVLIVSKDGTATTPLLAPRLQESNLAGHSLMIHAGGDNYSDIPKPLGGGGARVACAVFPSK